MAEISHMRTQHILASVVSYGAKVERKLEAVLERQRALAGDCVVLAASICFLGYFSPEERMQCRSDIARHIADRIPCSE